LTIVGSSIILLAILESDEKGLGNLTGELTCGQVLLILIIELKPIKGRKARYQ
jgi:hypothetical protein